MISRRFRVASGRRQLDIVQKNSYEEKKDNLFGFKMYTADNYRLVFDSANVETNAFCHSAPVYRVYRAALAACCGFRSNPVTKLGNRNGSVDIPVGEKQGFT